MKNFTLIIVSCILAATMQAQILHVPAEYTTIQAAVDAAGYGDTILVATGTYLENVMIQGNEKTITLASNFLLSGDTNDIINTVIDAGQPINPNHSMGVLIKNQDSTLNTKLIGFSIINGGGYYQTYGGGVYAWRATPVIEYNQIQNCYVTGFGSHGGGIHVGNDLGETNTTYIRENVIKNCTVNSTVWSAGGGISINSGKTVAENNQISHNLLTGEVASTYSGGGIYLLNPSEGTIISGNIITDNTLPEDGTCMGGGIFVERDELDTLGGIPLIERNRIQKNMAKRGGGIYCSKIGIKMINNILSGNMATIDGGGIKIYGPDNDYEITEIFNNTIFENTVSGNGSGGGMAIAGTSIFLLMNNIFYDDQASSEIVVNTGIINIYNCNIDTVQIQGNWKGESNFQGDPCICDDCGHITDTSCCIDSGIESLELGGVYYFAPTQDFEGESRPLNSGFEVGADEHFVLWPGVNESSAIIRLSSVVCYPNPFSEYTTFKYEIAEDGVVSIIVFNHLGQQVALPLNQWQAKGEHQVIWNANGMPPGIYFYQLAVGSQQSAVKGKLVKF